MSSPSSEASRGFLRLAFLYILTTDFTDCTEEYSHEFGVDGLEDFGYFMV